jgi:hypothetical protein
MFSDHLILYGLLAMLLILATLLASVQSFRALCPNKTLLHMTTLSLPHLYEFFFTLHNCVLCSQFNLRAGAPAAVKNRDLFSQGCCAPTYGKEGASC